MTLPTLSIPSMRCLVLAAQGLLQPPAAPAAKADVLAAIRRMGALQIDTINVVARSPYLSLWSRLGEYNPAWLDQLLAEGALFEYWAHAACFLPIEDYPYYRRRMFENGEKSWFRSSDETVARVLEHVRQNG